MTESSTDIRGQRLQNLEKLTAAGYAPTGAAFARSGTLAEIRAGFAAEKEVAAAGRLVSRREMGKSVFAHIDDGSGRFQLYIKKNVAGAEAFDAFRALDLGDLVGVHGRLFVTRTGEQTVQVESWELLSKSLRSLPEKWHGLQDRETRYRQRYLDLIANPDAGRDFRRRSAVIREIRQFLHEKSFIEVETPMLQTLAGGAAAEPFRTRYHALSRDMYLRIAPELFLKQLLVGGMDRIFELNRNFRNEGLDRNHNPEFTMLEVYEAYADSSRMQELIQALIIRVAERVFGTLHIGEGEQAIDLTPPWREIPYRDLIREHAGNDWFQLDPPAARQRAGERGLDVDPDWDHLELTHAYYEKIIERTLRQPTFVTRLPARMVPLARRCGDDPETVDVFELEIGGQEIAPGYSELCDAVEQRRRFEQQAGQDNRQIDESFMAALEHGMPPAGGMGVGIDRLLMILGGKDNIRDVMLFPHLKPAPEQSS